MTKMEHLMHDTPTGPSGPTGPMTSYPRSTHTHVHTDSAVSTVAEEEHIMHTFFHSGFGKDQFFLFETFPIQSLAGLCAAMILTFGLGVTFEVVKVIRLRKAREVKPGAEEQLRGSVEGSEQSYEASNNAFKQKSGGKFKISRAARGRVVQTLFYGLQLLVSYLLMLVVMTFNYWLLVSAILGAMFGFFVFGDESEAVMPDTNCC